MLSRIVWLFASIVVFDILLVAMAAVAVVWLHWLRPKLQDRRARRRRIAASAVVEAAGPSANDKPSPA